jgi:sugar (glycoside-pentoside-hexuronide) transporter
METKQVPFFERISYGLTDLGYNLVFMLIGTYVMYFYTDVFGLPSAVIAALFFFAKILDALVDPLVGMLMDRTQTKWGKFRPYWLWFSVPFGALCLTIFSVPAFPVMGKIIYAFITYIVINIMFSFVSLPISAILPSLTSNVFERSICNVIRMVGNIVGAIIVSATTMPLVALFGKGDLQKGFFMTALLFSILAIAIMLNGWIHTKERVSSVNNEPITMLKGIKSVVSLPWVLLLITLFLFNLAMTIKNQTAIYYVQYYLKRTDLVALITTAPFLFCIFTIVLSPYIGKLMGFRNACMLGFIISIIGNLVIVAAETNIVILLIGTAICYLGLGIPGGLLNVMFADTVDYAEWRTGIRATGINYAACSFGVKLGQGIGSALGATIMAMGHYVANTEQSPSSIAAIKFDYIWFGVIAAAIAMLTFVFYRLDKQLPQIKANLEKRISI